MKEEYQIFISKVPALRNKVKAILTILYILSLIVFLVIYFYYIDQIAWFMPIITQTLVSAIVILISYFHIKKAEDYRKKHRELAYQKFFYHYMIPYLVTWYALFFHPLFISHTLLFPFLISIFIAISLFVISVLVNLHIERAGFKVMTHGIDIYTVFPEETTIVRGEIYGYIRHPLCLALASGCFALAFVANNIVAILAAIIHLIPCVIVGKMEDKELIKRDGEVHLEYINSTALLFPFKKILGFLKLLFFFKVKK